MKPEVWLMEARYQDKVTTLRMFDNEEEAVKECREFIADYQRKTHSALQALPPEMQQPASEDIMEAWEEVVNGAGTLRIFTSRGLLMGSVMVIMRQVQSEMEFSTLVAKTLKAGIENPDPKIRKLATEILLGFVE